MSEFIFIINPFLQFPASCFSLCLLTPLFAHHSKCHERFSSKCMCIQGAHAFQRICIPEQFAHSSYLREGTEIQTETRDRSHETALPLLTAIVKDPDPLISTNKPASSSLLPHPFLLPLAWHPAVSYTSDVFFFKAAGDDRWWNTKTTALTFKTLVVVPARQRTSEVILDPFCRKRLSVSWRKHVGGGVRCIIREAKIQTHSQSRVTVRSKWVSPGTCCSLQTPELGKQKHKCDSSCSNTLMRRRAEVPGPFTVYGPVQPQVTNRLTY